MLEIEKLRLEIDKIDADLNQLFKRRLVLAQKIWEIKMANGIVFIDLKREDLILSQQERSSKDLDEKIAIKNFFKCLLNETKIYLEAKLK